jgi:hypothetical protein
MMGEQVNERDELVRRARVWLEDATDAMKLAVKEGDLNLPAHAGAMASISAACSALALVVPDPMPADLPGQLRDRIQAHHNKGNFGT